MLHELKFFLIRHGTCAMDMGIHTHMVMLPRHVIKFLTAQDHRVIVANSLLSGMPNRGKGGGKPADDEETPGSGPDRRLPREPLGPYNRPFPVDGCPWDRRMWASERRKGKGKGKTTSAGLLEIMIDQLPMLTEKGLRELMVSLSCELSFRGDVREQNEEVQLEYEANGGKG